MKSILLITAGFPYGTSEQSFIHAEFDRLRTAFDVHVLAHKIDEDYIQKGYENVETKRYQGRNRLLCYLNAIFEIRDLIEILHFLKRKNSIKTKIIGSFNILKYAAHSLYLKPQIIKEIEENHIEVIYTYWCDFATLTAIRCKKRFPGLKVITRFHGYDLYEERSDYGWQPYRDELSRELDGLFFACSYANQYFKEHWGRAGYISYLGTKERKKLQATDGPFVLISCSNLISLKRVDLIIRALALLPNEYKIKWYHFGDGPERSYLEKLAIQLLGKKETIEYQFCGAMDNEDLFQRYAEILPSLFITTSSTEGGVPVSIQEAQVLGIPAIGTNVGGIPEIIRDNENGLLLSENPTIEEISTKIMKFYNMNYYTREEFRNKARQSWSKSFNADNNARVFVEHVLDIFQ